MGAVGRLRRLRVMEKSICCKRPVVDGEADSREKHDMRKKGGHKGIARDSGRHEHGSECQEKSELEVGEELTQVDRKKNGVLPAQ